jgi:hypothetical protein
MKDSRKVRKICASTHALRVLASGSRKGRKYLLPCQK